MNGYVKLHRSMLEWEWLDDPITVQVWVYCLLKANYTLQRWHGETLMPGQFITSLGHMAKELGISRQNLKTAILHLKSTNNLTIKSTNKWTLVTIEKWDEYQSAGEKVTNKLTSNLTNNQPTANQQLTTDKEREEREERKEDRENKEREYVPNGQGAFAGAWYHDPIKYTPEETKKLLADAHQGWLETKKRYGML